MKRIIPVLFLALIITSNSFAQEAKDAYLALKKIEASVQVGVKFNRYSELLADAQFAMNLYLDKLRRSEEKLEKENDLMIALKEPLDDYKKAKSTWGNILNSRNSEANNNYKEELQNLWSKASKGLEEAGKLMK